MMLFHQFSSDMQLKCATQGTMPRELKLANKKLSSLQYKVLTKYSARILEPPKCFNFICFKNN